MMPYKKEYTPMNVSHRGRAANDGNSGSPAKIKGSHYVSRPTGAKGFPEATPSRGPKKNTHKPFKV